MRFSHLLGQLGQFTAETAFDLAGDPELTGAESLDRAGNGQLSFLEPGNPLATTLARTGASAVLIPAQGKEAETLREIARARGLAWVALADPRLGFAEALACLFPRRRQPAGIHPQAIVSDSAVVGAGCSIGARVVIGPNCTLGERCLIQPGAVLLENVTLGNDCEIHANAVIHTGSQLGHHCVVHSTAVIGSEGFGFVPTSTGWHKMPQTGVVVLEDQVEVGCGTTIDRPCVGETRIGAGTKIDNQVHIGHDVKIGNHCVMAAQVGVAGGSQIGNHVILAGQVGIANRTSVGDRVTASSKSGLHGCIPAGSVVSGYPAIEHKLWLRCVAIFSKLPQLSRAVKARQ